MQDESDLNHNVKRMQSVNEVLNNVEYQRAFISVKAHMINQLESFDSSQDKLIIEMHRKIKALNLVEAELETVMQTGKMSQKTLLDRIKNTMRI